MDELIESTVTYHTEVGKPAKIMLTEGNYVIEVAKGCVLKGETITLEKENECR